MGFCASGRDSFQYLVCTAARCHIGARRKSRIQHKVCFRLQALHHSCGGERIARGLAHQFRFLCRRTGGALTGFAKPYSTPPGCPAPALLLS